MTAERAGGPPKRGEIYRADLDPVVGHEQGGSRPFLVLSVTAVNRAPVDLALGLPLTTTDHGSKLHVRIEPHESGLTRISYAMPEMVRSLSTERFRGRLGRAPVEIVDRAAAHTGLILGLGKTRF